MATQKFSDFQVEFNGITWTVRFVEAPDENDTGTLGIIMPGTSEIRVSQYLALDRTMHTVLHELTHAVLEGGSTRYTEEQVCDTAASVYVQLLRQKSRLPQWLFDPPVEA